MLSLSDDDFSGLTVKLGSDNLKLGEDYYCVEDWMSIAKKGTVKEGLFGKTKNRPELRGNIRRKAGNVLFENIFTRIGFVLCAQREQTQGGKNRSQFMICDSDRFQRLDLLRKRSFVTETLLFAEEVLVKPRFAASGRLPKKLKIINRYRYSEYDTLVLDNYRISGKK